MRTRGEVQKFPKILRISLMDARLWCVATENKIRQTRKVQMLYIRTASSSQLKLTPWTACQYMKPIATFICRLVYLYMLVAWWAPYLLILASFEHSVRDLPDIMSANFLFFWLPLPCLHLDLIYTIKFIQPPLLCRLVHYPTPSDADIISGNSQKQLCAQII